MPSFIGTPAEVTINHHWGDNIRAVFDIVDAVGDPIDLTGGSVQMQVKTHPLDTTAIVEADSSGDEIIVDVSTITIDLPTPSSNPQYAFFTLYYDIQYTELTGGIITLIKGHINSKPEVTQ